jgi:hypothetical protein
MNGLSLASRQRLPKAKLVYWPPRSEWWMTAFYRLGCAVII